MQSPGMNREYSLAIYSYNLFIFSPQDGLLNTNKWFLEFIEYVFEKVGGS